MRTLFEEQLGGVLGLHAELLEISTALEPRPVALDQEQRDALGRRHRLSVFRREHHEIAELAVRDEHLLTVDRRNRRPDGVARVRIALRSLPACGSVMPSEPIDLSADHLRQPLALLLLAPEGENVARHEVPCGSGSPDRSPPMRHSSSNTIYVEEVARPRPPYSSGTVQQRSPSAPALCRSSRGTTPSSSHLLMVGGRSPAP